VRVFLDANVLFSAAYREPSGIGQLINAIRQSGGEAITSGYAIGEARHNLAELEMLKRLDKLMRQIEVTPEAINPEAFTAGIDLRDKDKPILAAAIQAEAQILLTGDKRDFGQHYGQTVQGLRVLSPAMLRAELEG